MDDLKSEEKLVWFIGNSTKYRLLFDALLIELSSIDYFETSFDASTVLESEILVTPKVLICEFTKSKLKFLESFSKDKKNTIIILMGEEMNLDDIRDCIRFGISDFLPLPINKELLFAKVEYILKKTHRETSVSFSSGVKIDGVVIDRLTSKQIQLVGLFLQAKSRTVSREDILNEIWEGVQVHPKVVDVHLYNLRRKLGPCGFMIKSCGGGRWALISTLYRRPVQEIT